MSLLAPVQTGCLIAFAMLLLLAAWQDLRTMHIADAVSVAIVAAFVLWALSGLVLGSLSFTAVGLALACAAATFGGGAAAFAAGALGGGDVKLLAAASLFAGPGLISDFLLVTALAGGALGIPDSSSSPTICAGSPGRRAICRRPTSSKASGRCLTSSAPWRVARSRLASR